MIGISRVNISPYLHNGSGAFWNEFLNKKTIYTPRKYALYNNIMELKAAELTKLYNFRC
jgi:hypothetical protein